MRELKFALTIDPSSLLCPNATEFFAKSYLTSDVADNFRTLPGIKYATEIATTTFTNILSASTCNWGSGTNPLISSAITVCGVSAMAEICRFDLEQSFVSAQMVQGSNGSYEVASFMNFYWDVMAKQIQEEIEIIRWRGNILSGGTIGLCDGHEKKLAGDGTVIRPTFTAVTSSNVLAAMAVMYNSMATSAPSLINKTAELRLYVAPNVAAAYRIAVAAGNTNAYLTKNLDLTYLDIKIVVCQGMTASKMILTLKDNLIYAFDAEGDSASLKAIDLSDTTAEPKLRTRANMKIGFHHVNGAEIVYYSV